MKLQKMTRKGFTLVELIVVITILAILGTIAFLSFQGYSASARDAKRTSDIRSLVSVLNTKTTDGFSLLNLVDRAGTTIEHAASAVYVAGSFAQPGIDYAAGKPNYISLGINSTNFKDPNGPDYAIATSIDAGGTYQLSAKLEKDGIATAMVQGNFTNRTATQQTFASISINPVTNTLATVTLTNTQVGMFKKGDIVALNTAVPALVTTGTITKISGDGKTLSITTGASAATAVQIILGGAVGGNSDVLGLIKQAGIGTNPVTDTSTTNLPY